MSSDLLFAPNIDMWSINPYNVKMGNEYLDNVITTALAIIPKVYIAANSAELKVTRAFVPKGKILEEKGIDANSYERKYGQGLALSFTWTEFNQDIAMQIAMDLFDNFNEGDRGIHIVVNPITRELSVYRKMKDTKLYLIVGQDESGYKRKTIRTKI